MSGCAGQTGFARIQPLPANAPDVQMINQQGGTKVDCGLYPQTDVFIPDLVEACAHAVYFEVALDSVGGREEPSKKHPETSHIASGPGKSTDKQQNKGEKQ